MSNDELDKLILKRLQANDFAKNDLAIVVVAAGVILAVAAAIILFYTTVSTYLN